MNKEQAQKITKAHNYIEIDIKCCSTCDNCGYGYDLNYCGLVSESEYGPNVFEVEPLGYCDRYSKRK